MEEVKIHGFSGVLHVVQVADKEVGLVLDHHEKECLRVGIRLFIIVVVAEANANHSLLLSQLHPALLVAGLEGVR